MSAREIQDQKAIARECLFNKQFPAWFAHPLLCVPRIAYLIERNQRDEARRRPAA